MRSKYYVRLDIVRIIACILIFLYHLNILKGGYLAVCTFFVLSGYLSCVSIFKERHFSFKKYYISRFKKIYLPLLIVVFSTVIISKGFNINWLNLKQETISVIFGYNNIWQLNANLDYFARHTNSPFIHLWYISILIQFDLIFPIIFVLLKKINTKLKSKNISTIIVSALTLLLTILFILKSKNKNIMLVYYNSILRSFSILYGVIFAIMYHKHRISFSREKYNKLLFIFYLLLLIILNIVGDINNYAIYMILVSIISVKLISYSIIDKQEKNNKILSFISKGTYEVYLVQYPIIFFMKNIVMNKNLKIVLIILLTIFISYILHIILESKKKFIKYFRYVLFTLIVLLGSFLVIVEKDHTKEMNELEDKLNNNLKQIESKNSKYINDLQESEKKWNEMLSNMENEQNNLDEVVTNLPVMGIGDSVMLGAINKLYEKFPNGYFDGKVSRSTVSGEKVLLDLKNSGKLGNILILGLATNTEYTNKRVDNIMDIVEDRQVYWINHVGGDDPSFNEKFAEYSKKYPNIHIVKWDEVAKGHPEYFYKDGIHTKGSGMDAYANAIYETIYNEYKKEYETKKQKLVEEHDNELKEKIVFYGNDLLSNSFSYIKDKYPKANFSSKKYSFDKLYKEIESKIKSNSLEYKIVFVFDTSSKFTKKNYIKLVDLCKNHEVYIVNLSEEKIDIDGVKIVNFSKELKKNPDYVMIDGVHLTDEGNVALVNKIYKAIK